MINTDELYYLGIIKRTKGNKAHLFCIAAVPLEEVDIGNLKHVFLELHEKQFIPFSVEDFQIEKKDNFTLKLAEIHSQEKAEKTTGTKIYIHASSISHKSNNKINTQKIIGYHVIDAKYGLLGKLEQIIENTAQDLLMIRNENNTEIFLPFVEPFILEINHKNKSISIEAPQGLLEIYLNKE